VPPQQPRQKRPGNRRWPYVLLLIGVAFISFVAGIAAGSAGHGASPASAVSTAPVTPAQVSTAGSSAAPSEAAARAAATGRVLATFTGNGIETTARFTVPRSGNWELKWSYSCASLGSRGNFIVDEDNDSNLNGVAVNELGTGGSGITHAYGDAGSHYLDVNSECDWSMSAVSLP